MEKKKIYETMENDVMNTELNEETKRRMLRNIMNLKNEKMNIMIVGATGCGKSSTINALFDTEIAKVGIGQIPKQWKLKSMNSTT